MANPSPEVRIPRPRIEGLADLVFGLALSIGAIVLITSPTSESPGKVLSSLLEFASSFVVLISMWVRYTRLMSLLPIGTRGSVDLNVALPFLVAIEPYLFDLFYGALQVQPYRPAFADFTTSVFAVDLAGLLAILGAMSRLVTRSEPVKNDPLLDRRFRRESLVQFATAGVFVVSILPPFFSVTVGLLPLRIWIWFAAMAVSWMFRARLRLAPS